VRIITPIDWPGKVQATLRAHLSSSRLTNLYHRNFQGELPGKVLSRKFEFRRSSLACIPVVCCFFIHGVTLYLVHMDYRENVNVTLRYSKFPDNECDILNF